LLRHPHRGHHNVLCHRNLLRHPHRGHHNVLCPVKVI
jgi:hypothetical protein